MYGIIYKITNKINNKVYIGQVVAKKGLAKRWKRHVDTAKSGANYLISIAIRKYGEDNFTIEEIDTADSREELNEKEIYWISYYQSFTDRNKGYNMTSGGDGGKITLPDDPNDGDLVIGDIDFSDIVSIGKYFISLVNSLLDVIGSFPKLFSTVFSFLPSELVGMIYLSIVLIIIIGLIKAFL